jgi:hypothetical protein
MFQSKVKTSTWWSTIMSLPQYALGHNLDLDYQSGVLPRLKAA